MKGGKLFHVLVVNIILNN